MTSSALVSRRLWLAGVSALALSGCGRKAKTTPSGKAGPQGNQAEPGTLEWAINGDWRSPADRTRDADRHPLQTLQFFGLQPGMTVVEMWPGGGWYSEILAPFLASTKGKLYAANLETPNPDDRAAEQVVAAYRKQFSARPDLYGAVEFTAFGPHSGPLAPAGAADLVLFFNLNNWMAAGVAEKAFHDAFEALRHGGVLGIEQARGAAGGGQDPAALSGYIQSDYVKQMAAEAGFRFDGSSEINANPKDSRDHPFGIWTLLPTRRSSPMGRPPNPLFDHKKYDSLGEPDRMTLRFLKP